MRLVSSNFANYHTTVQKLLIRQVLTKPMVWSWKFSWRQCVVNVCTQQRRDQVALIVSRVINKPTTDELCSLYHLSTDDLLWWNFLSKLLMWSWPRPLREHSLITWLRLHMAPFQFSSGNAVPLAEMTLMDGRWRMQPCQVCILDSVDWYNHLLTSPTYVRTTDNPEAFALSSFVSTVH